MMFIPYVDFQRDEPMAVFFCMQMVELKSEATNENLFLEKEKF